MQFTLFNLITWRPFLVLGRRPRRPFVAGTITTFGYAVPCALLALHGSAAVLATPAIWAVSRGGRGTRRS